MEINKSEIDWLRGNRAAYVRLLGTILGELGYDSPEAQHVGWITEREEAIAILRGICAEHGDNEWDERLHLADVIQKHLGDYLNNKQADEPVGSSRLVLVRVPLSDAAATSLDILYAWVTDGEAGVYNFDRRAIPPHIKHVILLRQQSNGLRRAVVIGVQMLDSGIVFDRIPSRGQEYALALFPSQLLGE